MTYPIRCYSCHKPLRWTSYLSRIESSVEDRDSTTEKVSVYQAMDDLGYTRDCCRRMFLSDCQFNEHMIKYSFTPDDLLKPRVVGVYDLSKSTT